MKFHKAETDGKSWFVTYSQSVDGVPVYRTEIGYTVNQDGDIIALGADAYRNVSIATTPRVSISQRRWLLPVNHSDSIPPQL